MQDEGILSLRESAIERHISGFVKSVERRVNSIVSLKRNKLLERHHRLLIEEEKRHNAIKQGFIETMRTKRKRIWDEYDTLVAQEDKKHKATHQILEGFLEKINATADKLHGGSGPMRLYKADVMTTIKQQNPTANDGEVSKLVMEKWQTLTHEQKQPYEDAYKERIKEFLERMKEYHELKNKYSNPPTPPGFWCENI